MYSFAPLPEIYPSHFGFWLIVCFFVVLYCIWLANREGDSWVSVFSVCAVFIGSSYLVSYVFTDQNVIYPRNEKVIGEFVSFQAEGYNERSGKSRADHHYTYVVYSVNGNNILLPAETATEYPKHVILYKN